MNDEAAKISARLAEIALAMEKLFAERNVLTVQLAAILIPFKVNDRIRERHAHKRRARTFEVVSFRDKTELSARAVRADGSLGIVHKLWCYGDWAEKYEKVAR